ELADPARRQAIAAACRRWASCLTWDQSTERMAALISSSVHYGTTRAIHPGTWIVCGADQQRADGVLAEGPPLDLLLATIPGLTRSRARRDSAPPESGRRVWRLPLTAGTRRILGFCLLLMALPFLTVPGKLIADTKFDLAIDPVRFLTRALHLWDPQQFGQ